MTSKKTSLVAAAAALALAGSLGACSASDSDDAMTPIDFGLPTTMGANNAPLAVAVGLGYFEDEGLDVNIVGTGGSAPTVQAVLSGQLDIGSATPEPVLQLAESGAEFGGVTMIYNYIRKPTGAIAVLADSDFEKLEDFAGVTIGNSSLGSGNLILANAILSSVGLEQDQDFSHVAVGTGAAALQALTSNEVQALSLWDTEYAAMEVQGVELRTFTSEQASELFSTTFFASPRFIEENPDAVIGFGRAMARATYFTQLNPSAALRVMYEAFPETRAAGLSEEEQLTNDLVALEARLTLLTADDPQASGQWGSYSAEAVTSWTEFAFTSEIIGAELDPATLYTNDFVADYNDFDAAAVEADAQDAR